MARRLGRLTVAEIARKGPGRYHDGGGLYLLVGKGAARSWVFRFRRDGKLHDYGLGPVHSVTLTAARQRAFECRAALYAGGNPVEIRRTQRLDRVRAAAKAVTFREAAERHIAAHTAGWRDAEERQWRQQLADHAYPLLGPLPVAAIDTDLVLRVLTPIWYTNTETATRVRRRIEAVLDGATVLRLRQGENPARWRGHLDKLLPARRKVQPGKHFAALPFVEIAAVVADLRRHEGVAARALEFAILTAARTGEVLGATWREVDLAERLWTIPAERMKAGKAHRVPLSDDALRVLQAIRGLGAPIDGPVFPGRDGALGGMALRRMLALLRPGVTVHGLRATFRTWVDTTDHPREAAEMALAHAVGNAIEAAYRRGDMLEKRRALMRDWAQYCGPVRSPARLALVSS